ncbi:MAG TPA: type VI secretion system tube protein Hcp [Terriglobales bacterium]
MLSLGRLWSAACISVLCLGLALPAVAAETIYMSINSSKQGPIKGEGKAPHAGEWMPVISISQGAGTSMRDATSGQGSGKRQHETIKIVKEIGSSTPQLQKALATGELFKEVVFELYRPGKATEKDKVEPYETIRLTDAMITSIQSRGAGAANNRPQEEISFQYGKIEYTYSEQKQSPATLQPVPVMKPATPLPR